MRAWVLALPAAAAVLLAGCSLLVANFMSGQLETVQDADLP